MTKRRRILHADKIIQNVVQLFCLLMFLQLKGYYSVETNPILLFSTASDIRMVNTSRLDKVNTILKGLESGSAVDFLYRTSLICWSDQMAELIQCSNYNDIHIGEKVTIVSEGLITPTGIAIDWYTGKIYWTDGETNKIEVISVEQKYRKVLFWSEVDLARAIAVVPKEGLLFWTDWGEVPKIERAGMNGDHSTREVIVKDDIFWPNGITIDYNNNLIYWVDAQLHFIDSIDFNGENRKRIVKTELVYPYAITVINEKLFWTDWKTWAIHTWDMSSNSPKVEALIKSKTVPIDIKVYDESRQLMPEEDYPCKHGNGGCSHLCLLSPKEPGYSCACPTGVKLRDGSNTSCHDGPQAMLVIAQRSTISKISLDSPDFTPFALPLKDLKRAQSVDFDPKSEYIYWTDNLAKTISKARLDGSDQSVVIQSSGVPDSIAIDPLARNLYWTDPAADTISVARLDGSSKKILVHYELYQPRAIALHPEAGWMFWSDWNEKRPKIERASLDGTARTVLVADRLAWPNGIALDLVAGKLYWGDARTHKIEVCNLDGSQRKELVSTDILHIFGLTLLGDYLYWTDMQKRTLDCVNKHTGASRRAVAEQMPNMMGVKAFRVGVMPMRENRCATDNGGCSHLCLCRPDNCTCACPLGLELSKDHKTCVEPQVFLVYSRENVIGRLSIENEGNDAVIPIKDLKEVSAIAVYVPGNKLYWADSKTRTINRCSINGANVEKILDWTGVVEGLAIDWSSQNMYWTDSSSQRIEVARLDGSSRRALIWQGLKKPKSIVLDPKRGFMYWSELGSRSIRRAGMDGSSPAPLIEGVGKVHALAIDSDRRALYWAALDPATVATAKLDGTQRRSLATDGMPYALALSTDRLYWADWNTGVVESANKTDGSGRRRELGSLEYVSGLRAWRRGGGAAGCASAACRHLCLPAPRAPRCACPQHYRLRADNVSCEEPEQFLLFAQKNAVGRIVIANGECSDAFIPLSGLKNVKAIDYDPVDSQLYWIEEESQSIRFATISSSPTSAGEGGTVPGTSHAAFLALDVLGRTLYWAAADGDCVNVTTLNGSVQGVILKGDGMRPRQLAFHQTKRYLVWNDVGLGGIMRANVDGTERVQLARANNASALALDLTNVYWAAGKQIHTVDISGSNRRVVWQGGAIGALGAAGGWLYLGGERAARLPLHRRDAPALPVPHLARLAALRSVHEVSKLHACYGGGACGVAACGAGGACGCGLTCTRAPPPCADTQLACDDKCIPLHWRCDGQHDCADGADEAVGACGACGAGLRCADGACAAALTDCAAGAYCAHLDLPQAFRCDERRLCLAASLLCDGVSQCADGADEARAACGAGRGRGGARALIAVAGAAAAAGALGAAWLLLRRWRKRVRDPVPHALPLVATKPLDPRPPSDTSTTESSCGRYPRPTINPPPSPATASSGAGAGAGGGAGRRRAYRHYRAINRPPPPTPASTDAAESEPEARAPPPSPAPPLYRH